MEDWVKIGKSSRPVDIRSKELDNTAVPLPFQIYATIRQNREFFNIPPSDALEIMRGFASLLDDAEITVYNDNPPAPAPRPNFKFHMIGLRAGDFVTFDPLGIEVKVASDDRVEYEDRLYSLSSFAGNFMPEERQNKSGSYQGPLYFSYKGKNLLKLRNEMDSGNSPAESEETSGD